MKRLRAARFANTNTNVSLWGDGIHPEDLNQGRIGNCWFMAAASAIADIPQRIDDLFLTKTLNE